MKFERCPICEWRRTLIKHDDATYTDPSHSCSVDTLLLLGDASQSIRDSPHWSCDSASPKILRGLHLKPSQMWIDIISTARLCSPRTPVVREGRVWLCIPLRLETDVRCSNCHYCYDGCWKASHETVIGYHNTRLESLVAPTPQWNGMNNGSGILVDGRLQCGCCTHNGLSGVNVYSDGGHETFAASKGWVQLEVRCTNTTKLQGGRPNRYCIRGENGEVCYKAALLALWIPYDEVPSIVVLS